MAEIVVTGAGIAGLTTAMLLAGDGHDVTVLERDPMPPSPPLDAWESWERRGVNQFRLLHFFMPRYRKTIEAELPLYVKALDDAGVLRFNAIALIPDEFKGGERAGDDEFEALTGRRPVVESVLAQVAEATPGVTVRRGVPIDGLIARPSPDSGVPHVTGVRTADGDMLAADLVVDVTGRRSPLPDWLEAIGTRRPVEELEDSGFMYYGRHFRSADGAIPAMVGPLLQDYGTISVLTLPADNGTWGVGVITSAKDAAVRGLRDADRWTAAVRSLPLAAHWVEGEPFEAQIVTMAKIEDRYRTFVADGQPLASGVVTVGDSWACTNPSVGRGATIATLHAVALRNLVRDRGLDDPVAFAAEWDEVTNKTVEPWYRDTLAYDRHRLAEIEAGIEGKPYEPGDPGWEMTKALSSPPARIQTACAAISAWRRCCGRRARSSPTPPSSTPSSPLGRGGATRRRWDRAGTSCFRS
jgi:2-polyprenyl-6-methoxyphenol hydroxylase-like FAD-dependent oxidoreductase